MKRADLRDKRIVFLVNPKDDSITKCYLMQFKPYPYGYGFITQGSDLYIITEKVLNNMYRTREEAESNIHNLFSVMTNN